MFRHTRRLLLGSLIAVSGIILTLGTTIAPAHANTSGTVEVAGGGLNVRSSPSTGSPAVGRLPNGASLSIICQQTGQYVDAGPRPTAQWDKLAEGRYVTHAYVRSADGIPSCPAPPTALTGTARTEGGPLNVRGGPSTSTTITTTVPNWTVLTLVCQVTGQQISGTVRTSTVWIRLASGAYVSYGYIVTSATVPACNDLSPGPRPGMTNAQFIAASVGPGQQGYREYHVPVSVTIAQAIIESGWGRSGLAASDRNFFGIKCFDGNPGPIANGCHVYRTTECEPTCRPTTASFRTYATARDSYRDHGRFLTVNSRYAPAFAYSHDANRFLHQIWRAGYATSPTYYDDVTRIMRQYNLYQYDLP